MVKEIYERTELEVVMVTTDDVLTTSSSYSDIYELPIVPNNPN